MSFSDNESESRFEAELSASASALASALDGILAEPAADSSTERSSSAEQQRTAERTTAEANGALPSSAQMQRTPALVTQVDYAHYFIPEMTFIANCPFYWGKIDRYEAEALLEDRPEGSFLLRDSAQDEFVFSVSFRRYNRSLHARIEEKDHRFSFDSHDPGVYASFTIAGLLAHYKEPLACMFFEPLLVTPVIRSRAFSLVDLARASICDHCSYNDVSALWIPETLKKFVREYSYRHKIGSRQIGGTIFPGRLHSRFEPEDLDRIEVVDE